MSMPQSVKPSILMLASDPIRACYDMTTMAFSPALLASLPHGDGHPILILPGFMAGDSSTVILRRFLSRLDYSVYGWDLGVNLGPRIHLQKAMRTKFSEIRRRHNDQKITVIGQSLGGIYARLLGSINPDQVRMVISLGSPYQTDGADKSWPKALFERMMGDEYDPVMETQAKEVAKPLNVPTTSIFSKFDGIVPWQACIEPETNKHENIQVYCSHIGMAMHTPTLRIIANRLAQPKDTWAPYERTFLSGLI